MASTEGGEHPAAAEGMVPPVAVSANPGISPVSTITTPSSGARRPIPRDFDRINQATIADLANDVLSPIKRMDPFQEEEMFDRAAYEANPGAEDSEDEDRRGCYD